MSNNNTNTNLNEIIQIPLGEMFSAFDTIDAEAYGRGFHDGRAVATSGMRRALVKAETRGVWKGGIAAITGVLIGMVVSEGIKAYADVLQRKAAAVTRYEDAIDAQIGKFEVVGSASEAVKEVADVVQD